MIKRFFRNLPEESWKDFYGKILHKTTRKFLPLKFGHAGRVPIIVPEHWTALHGMSEASLAWETLWLIFLEIMHKTHACVVSSNGFGCGRSFNTLLHYI